MAKLLSFACRQSILKHIWTRQQLGVPKVACISTSKKHKDVLAGKWGLSVPESEVVKPARRKDKTREPLDEKDENWISFGYDYYDRANDEWQAHIVAFGAMTALCWAAFLIAYFPDMQNMDWAQREAYLELARRETEGLPLIDPNLIDPSKIDLPSEEELRDFEIII